MYRILSALILLFTVVTSVSFAADTEFRKSMYFKVIWMTIFQMLIVWLVSTSFINYDPIISLPIIHSIFLFLFLSFLFLCLFPTTMNIWLSSNFRHTHCRFIKKSKVLIPQQYGSFIENDKKYGFKYQLISSQSIASNNNNNNRNNNNCNSNISDNKQKMNKYWKFKTNKLCIIECVKNRNILNSKQTLCLHFSTITKLTMCFAILEWVIRVIDYITYYDSYYDEHASKRVRLLVQLLINIVVATIPGIIIGLIAKRLFKHDFRLIDTYHWAMIFTCVFTFHVFTYATCSVEHVVRKHLQTYYNCINTSALDYPLYVYCNPWLISLFYVMYVSLIARYTFCIILVCAGFVVINFNTLFAFDGYTNVLGSEIQAGVGWQLLIMILWFLMLFVLLSLVLYIKLHPKSKKKSSGLYQLNLTIGGIFSALLDYITDIIVIIFWFVSNEYFYATFEILFILIGQFISSLYINDIYIANNPNCNSKNTTRNQNESYFVRVLLGLGIGRIYFSIIPWNENETLKSRHKMCKIWEMLFESMPSVGLSTYAILVNSINFDGYNTRNTSVLVSMLFSFINITNTIVNLLENDRQSKDSKHAQDKPNNDETQLAAVLNDASLVESTPKPAEMGSQGFSNMEFEDYDLNTREIKIDSLANIGSIFL